MNQTKENSWILNDLNKLKNDIQTLNMSEDSSSTSSSSINSSISSNTLDQYDTLSRPLSNQSIKHKMTTSKLKDYGESYKMLGRGTTAIIMLIRKLDDEGRSEKLYAIKQFKKKQKNQSNKEFMKKLSSEFCISSTFNHPNIIQTIDLVLDDKNRYCTVMEYCPGGDLFSCIMLERITKIEKYCCFKQLLNGLAYLHSMGVAHRDIKPENLLLTMDGRLKITDFGVSDVFRFPWETKGKPSKGLVGSEPYIAPEAFTQDDYWGTAADVWSSGIVFYCLLMGGLTWYKAKKVDSAYASYLKCIESNTPFDLFKSLTEQEKRILYTMLDPNPSTRATALDLLNDSWIKSIEVCGQDMGHPDAIHKHTEGIRPACITSSRKEH